MQIGCARCGHVLEFSAQPPRFCSNCGQPLSQAGPGAEGTRAPDPDATVDHASPRRPAAPEVPEAVGGYRLLRPLGGGGMGSVFEAEEAASGRHVALKLIRPEFADSADAVERFRREGRLAATIAHPRCVFVLAADEDAGRPYIVMELMPGATLQDLVEQAGPLPPAEAVARILDVIEGLQEAHRCGVVHRDVKPSNCFLDAGGRVKVGDFGLAKSLVQAADLTRSGTFLGTVLFAAPEQVRNDRVNHLADVYSVSATLYYLLTGRAPFQADDPATALARAVSDPLTPMRHFRPELPRTLDAVVARGLARSRSRRWQGLEELRLALLPFVPGPHSLGEVGWRVGAIVCDALLLGPLEFLVQWVIEDRLLDLGPPWAPSEVSTLLLGEGVALACGLVWFALPEALWGCSLGKYVTRLRVRTVATNDRPGLARSCLRTACFYALRDGGFLALSLILILAAWEAPEEWGLTGAVLGNVLTELVLPLLATVAGLALMASTMRRRNGYRGLHELWSGTKVIRLPAASSPSSLSAPARPEALARPAGLPARIGAFVVQGALRWAGEDRVLVGEDPVLGRRVWLWLRPAERGPLLPGRAEVSRGGRPRWLGAGREGPWQWDAFVAAPGCLLADLVGGRQRLLWPETLHLLEQLTAELVSAAADGALPATLGPEQVWVQPTGRALLLDTPLREGPRPPAQANGGAGERAALGLLWQVAALALAGKPLDEGEALRAPVPGNAATLLRRLAGGPGAFATLAELHSALAAARERPAEVSRARRGAQVALSALTLGPGLASMLGVGLVGILLGGFRGPPVELVVAFWPALWVLWAALTRGGLAQRIAGVALVQADGRRAARWRCGWRALLVWAPLAALLLLSLSLAPGHAVGLGRAPAWLTWWLALALLPLYAWVALRWPNRGPHDRLAGTYLVPR
jgi:tRNA A-37 threonylcarbamoyl transferase component Bud32